MQACVKIAPQIYNSPLDINHSNTFFHLKEFNDNISVMLKLEGLNSAGSIKIKPALKMIESMEEKGLINPEVNTIIESSSGSLGIALSLICKMKGYKFICISDPNINDVSKKYIELYGARLIIVDKRDENGGFLNTRINYIKELLSTNSSYVWLNQYASEYNVLSHYETTAKEIFDSFGEIDFLFVGVGTSGTIMGCSNYIKNHKLKTKLIAVDAKGSVSFGLPAGKRLIPGIGTSRKPEILQPEKFNDIVIVSEKDTVNTCKLVLDKYGLFIGGSTGSVLSGINQYKTKLSKNATVVAISPDFGDRYIDTIYSEKWVNDNFGK